MSLWILWLGLAQGVSDTHPKYVLREGRYVRVPYGSLRTPCDGKLPIRDNKVLLFETPETDFATVGKAIKGTFYLWREYPCKDKKVHGIAKEFRSGKVVEAVPYQEGEVEGKKHVFYPNGKIKEILHFDGGEREGEYRKFDSAGNLMIVANYDDNRLDGEVRYFDKLRNVITVFEYDDGKVDGEPRYETKNVQEALILASRNGHRNQVKELLKKGLGDRKPELDAYGETDATAETALIGALSAGHLEVVKLLLEKGADPNRPTRPGRLSPLMVAVLSNRIEAMDLLLGRKADPNWQNGDGNTALHLAVDRGAVELAQKLIAGGARTDVRNKRGVTPAALGKTPKMQTVLKGETPTTPAQGGE